MRKQASILDTMDESQKRRIEDYITKLKSDFEEILELYENILKIHQQFVETSDFLKQKYNYFINLDAENSHIEKKIVSEASSETSFVLGLDTFHFQKKLIDLEISNISQVISLLNNQIYCNYYKLYKNIFKEMNSFIIEKKLSDTDPNKYPKYNALEPFLKYDIAVTKQVHTDIIYIIEDIYQTITLKEDLIRKYLELSKTGISIRNIINTFKFDKNVLIEKMMLYIDYMNCYHSSQHSILLKIKKNMENLKEQFLKEIIINENATFDVIPNPTPDDGARSNTPSSSSTFRTYSTSLKSEMRSIVNDIETAGNVFLSSNLSLIDPYYSELQYNFTGEVDIEKLQSDRNIDICSK